MFFINNRDLKWLFHKKARKLSVTFSGGQLEAATFGQIWLLMTVAAIGGHLHELKSFF